MTDEALLRRQVLHSALSSIIRHPSYSESDRSQQLLHVPFYLRCGRDYWPIAAATALAYLNPVVRAFQRPRPSHEISTFRELGTAHSGSLDRSAVIATSFAPFALK